MAAAAGRAHAGACQPHVICIALSSPPLTACFPAQEEASAALPGNVVLATPLNEVPASASGEELADWGGQWRKPGGK